MEFFTAQDRTGPITIENRAITLPASGDLPFFWGNHRSLAKGILVSNDESIFYQLSTYELFYIRKAFQENSTSIITAPFDRKKCDDWFISLDKNKLIITDNFVVTNETARTLLHFGGVMDNKGDFVFKTIINANTALEMIIARRKVKTVTPFNKHSLTGFLRAEYVEGKSILIVNPSDFVTSEICELAENNMLDFVETSGFLSKKVVSKGGVLKANSIYGLDFKNKYDFILFAGDCNETNELVPRSCVHLRETGKLAFISPINYRKNASRFVKRLVAITSEFSKKLDDNEITLIDRNLIAKSQLVELLNAA